MLYRRIVAITQRCLGGNSATSCLGRWALHLLAVSSKALGLAMARSAEPPPPTAEEPFTLLHTRQTLVGLRASEMAYFSTIFKPEVTVTAQAGDADKDQHFFYLVLHSQTCSMSTPRMGELLDTPAQVPTEWGLERSGPALGCGESSAAGVEAGSPGSRAAGRRGWFGCGGWWLWNYLTFTATWGIGHTWWIT